MLPSKWKVTWNVINDKSMYAVYRLKDSITIDHPRNREYATDYMEDRDQAVKIADDLNNQNDILLDCGIHSPSERACNLSDKYPIAVEALRRLSDGEVTPNQVRVELGFEPLAEDWANVKCAKGKFSK